MLWACNAQRVTTSSPLALEQLPCPVPNHLIDDPCMQCADYEEVLSMANEIALGKLHGHLMADDSTDGYHSSKRVNES